MLDHAHRSPRPSPRLHLVSSPINLFLTLTPAHIRMVRRELHRLPAGWFRVRAATADDPGGLHQYTYAALDQIGGPAIGAGFTISRQRDHFVVGHRQDERAAMEYWPAVRTIEEAMLFVQHYIHDVLTTWGLQVA